jgi:energy-coupling factor transporter ATP-binding protein EcfA2
MTRDQMESTLLPLINEQPSIVANFNTIRVKRDNLYILYEDYFTCSKSNLATTDLHSRAIPWDAKKEILGSNCLFICAQSGAGKTTLLKSILGLFPEYQVKLYSLKNEEFLDGQCKNFEPENLKELESFLSGLKGDKGLLNEKTLIVIDEFFVLTRAGEIGSQISRHISDLLPYSRAYKTKIILLSQTLNKAKLKESFHLDLVNLKIVSLPQIGSYQDSLGYIPGRYFLKLKRGQFIKFGLDDEPVLVSHSVKK